MRRLICPLLLLFLVSQGFTQSYPEVDAFLDALFAKDTKTLFQFFPENLQNALQQLPEAEQAAFERTFLVSERAKEAGVTLRRSEAFPVILEVEEKSPANDEGEAGKLVKVELEKRLSDGYECLLRLRVDSPHAGESEPMILVWMRLEDGQWRVLQVQPTMGGPETVNFDDPKSVDKFRMRAANVNEAAAVGSLRTYNTALVTYSSAYPELGFPSSLAVLGGAAPCDTATAEHACLVDPTLGTEPFERSGYRFSYQSNANGRPGTSYILIARPITVNVTGKRSFLTDESGVIRYTEEDRDPTTEDPPLQ